MACTATLTDRDTVITCERTHDGPDPSHVAEFFGAVYTWEAGAAEYRFPVHPRRGECCHGYPGGARWLTST